MEKNRIRKALCATAVILLGIVAVILVANHKEANRIRYEEVNHCVYGYYNGYYICK